MPDWTHEEQSQIPDAPETPAPLFAYRALRGILFGSPDYDEEEGNKENVAPIAPIPVSFNAKSACKYEGQGETSIEQPENTRPLSSRIRDLAPPATSPRKRMLSSPAKSILRTPGLPTPRRQKANVTFKNVRSSTSPVAKPTKGAETTKVQETGGLRLKKTEAPEPARNKNIKKTTNTDEELEGVPTPVYDVTSVDSYLQSTEREMKRLVRYSQKMREYARRSDQENVALKREMDRLKQEVELLKASNKTQKASGKKLADRTKSSDKAREGAHAEQPRNKATSQVRSTTIKQDSPGQGAARKATLVSIGRKAIEEPLAESSLNWIDLAKPHDKRSGAKDDSHHDGGGQKQDAARATAPRTTSAPTKAQLAPDRLAAAKERLRVKNEQRRRVLSS